jgi:hypothetical protein
MTAIRDKYGYFIRGRELVVIEWVDSVISNAPPYVAPSSTISDGLMLEYTAIDDLSEILTEKDILPVHDTLALAVVDYVKAQLVEDMRDYAKKEYFMTRFKNRIAKYTNARVGGLRRVLGDSHMR